MIDPIKFFTDRYPLTVGGIEELLGVALSQGGEYADLFFEYSVVNNLSLEEGIVKSAGQG